MPEYITVIEGVFVDPLDGVFDDRVGVSSGGRIYRSVGENARGKLYKASKTSLIFPGFINPHVHLRQNGRTRPSSDDYITGFMAAKHGGVTTMCAMGNTMPAIDSRDALMENYAVMQELCGKGARIKLIPVLRKEMIEDRERLRGILETADIIKVFMCESTGGVYVPRQFFEPLLVAVKEECERIGTDVLIDLHCEDQEMNDEAAARLARQSYPSIHCDQRPGSSEIAAIGRALDIAMKYGLDANIAHVSTAGGFDVVREHMRRRPGKVSFEVTPHHAHYDRSEMERQGAYVKMNPPLREAEDRERAKKELLSGEAIFASDHAGHTKEAKEGPKPPSGTTSLDHHGAFVSHLLSEGADPVALARATSLNAAERFRFPDLGRIADDHIADLVELDSQNPVRISRLYTKCGHTPYPLGDDAWPEVRRVWLGGELLFRDGEPVIS